MLPKLPILFKGLSAILMMAALFFLTTANFWVYGFQKQKQAVSSVSNPAEEEGHGSSVPNPVEEKNSNSLQTLSEYLHDAHDVFTHPVSIILLGNRHDIITLPIHHPELLTPPPKQLS